jgi:hypothetical protein
VFLNTLMIVCMHISLFGFVCFFWLFIFYVLVWLFFMFLISHVFCQGDDGVKLFVLLASFRGKLYNP